MKTLIIIAAIAAFLIFVPFKSANAQVNLNRKHSLNHVFTF